MSVTRGFGLVLAGLRHESSSPSVAALQLGLRQRGRLSRLRLPRTCVRGYLLPRHPALSPSLRLGLFLFLALRLGPCQHVAVLVGDCIANPACSESWRVFIAQRGSSIVVLPATVTS